MSRDALKDAFIAGWNMREASYGPDARPLALFDAWYTNTLDTLERANPDGWIEWDGSADMPPGLSGDTPVVVRCRNGGEVDDWTAGRWNWSGNGVSHQHQIIAYRVVRS